MEIEELRKFDDIHTHIHSGPNAVCSLPPHGAIALSQAEENQPYSIELHPWHASLELIEQFKDACEICRNDKRFVAIGECGLDSLCDTPFDIQKESFRQALLSAKELQKPVLIHIVKAWDSLFEMIDRFGDKKVSPIIIHGYRKNATLARQLVNMGYYLSLGEKYNADVPKLIPIERIFHETDEILEK